MLGPRLFDICLRYKNDHQARLVFVYRLQLLWEVLSPQRNFLKSIVEHSDPTKSKRSCYVFDVPTLFASKG